MAANLNLESRFGIQPRFENGTTNERTHAKIQRPEKWTNLKQQQNQKRLIITTTNSSTSRSCGSLRNLHLDDEIDDRFRANSTQMPSMITSGSERPQKQQQRRKQRLGCLSVGRRAGQSGVMRPTSSKFNGNVSLRALLAGLLHQIVIVSLILHKFPALRATRTLPPTLAQVGPSNGQTIVEPTTMTFDHHLGNNLHNFNHQQGYLIELPTLIYTDKLLGSGSLSEQAGQKTNSEHQQQRPPSSLQTKEELQEEATNGIIGNNQRHRQEARSFIKAPSELVAHNELMQTVHRHGLPPSVQLRQHNDATAAATDDNHYQRHRRTKRHLGPMLDEDSVAMVADSANQYATPPPLRANMMMSKRPAPDCHKLAALWLYLQSSYPVLADHLVELATGTNAPKAGQLSRSIGQILDDAERLTVAVTRPQKGAMSLASHRHSPAWLARISSNSAYGKLVQHLRTKQLNQLNQQQPPSSSGVVSKELAHGAANKLAQRQQQQLAADLLSSGPDDANGEQMVSSMSQPRSPAAATTTSQVVYGRLVNYPHEIGLAADNSQGMARTLDKLRLLNHHSKQQRQQLASGDIVETNKIPLAAADLADQTGADRSKLAESAADLARNNFVYGTMLLRPSSANDQDRQRSPPLPFNHHHNHHQRPMSTLRELANEQVHQRQMHSGQQPMKTAASQISFPSSDTNYGRILTSPPSDIKHSNNNNDKSDLRQTTDNSGGGASASDELLSQQSVGQAAAEGGDGDGEPALSGSSNNGDEFEGEFHSSPLKQAEVRLLRSLDHQHQRPAELMQQPQPESATRRADFVID